MTAPLTPRRAADLPVYVVAGGNHVTILLDAPESDGAVDAVQVLAQPGGGPPPHQHAFGEWFRVLAGEPTICEDVDVRVPDELTPPDRQPPGPDQLAEISHRYGIEFWTGPVDRRPQGATSR